MSKKRSLFTCSGANVRPHSPPNCQVPKPTTETERPVLPKTLYFIAKASHFSVLEVNPPRLGENEVLYRKVDRLIAPLA